MTSKPTPPSLLVRAGLILLGLCLLCAGRNFWAQVSRLLVFAGLAVLVALVALAFPALRRARGLPRLS